MLDSLTRGLAQSSSSDGAFVAGPFGSISGIIDRFDVDFVGTLREDFEEYFDDFFQDLSSLDLEHQGLISQRPLSMPRMSELLQLGSKRPSVEYSPVSVNHRMCTVLLTICMTSQICHGTYLLS